MALREQRTGGGAAGGVRPGVSMLLTESSDHWALQLPDHLSSLRTREASAGSAAE